MNDIEFIELSILNRVTGYYKDERNDIIKNIPSDLFITPLHRNCYKWVLNNLLKGKQDGLCLDFINILEKAHDMEYLTGGFQLKTWINELKEAKSLQIMEEASAGLAKNKDVTECFNKLKKIKQLKDPEVTNGKELLHLYLNREEKYGVPTGISIIDNHTKKLIPNSFWVVGGYSSMGKTSLIVQIIYNIISFEKSVVFYSLETQGQDIMARLLQWAQYELRDRTEAIEYLNIAKLEINNKKTTLDEILIDIESRTENPDVVFIDYLQIMDAEGKSEYEKLNNITRGLKLCTMINDVCIVALSQVSNEYAKTNQKIMSFKGSGSIIANCDVAIELKRGLNTQSEGGNINYEIQEELKPNEAEIILWKNRFGKGFIKKKYAYNQDIGFIDFNPQHYEQAKF